MKQEQLNNDLANNATSDVQKKIRDFVQKRVKFSCDEMQKYHNRWEESDLIYRGFRLLDKKDEEAVAKKEPPKIIIPISYALTQTALSFLMTTFFVDNRLFRLQGTGPEDQRVLEGMERDVAYQVNKMGAYTMLYNWLQDAFKYGLGVTKSRWVEEEKNFRVRERRIVEKSPGATIAKAMRSFLGGDQTEEDEVELVETIKGIKVFEGTKVDNVSPYCFYPDPSVPISRFQDGSFVASEEETTTSAIAGYKHLHGVSKIPATMPQSIVNERPHRVGRYSIFKDIETTGVKLQPSGDVKLNGAVLLIELEFTATKRSLKKDFDYDLEGPYSMDDQIKMVATIANDQKVLQFEPLGYLHGQYNYDVIEYSPDHNSLINPGLTDTIYNIQELMTWFLNSHVMNVRKAIKNRFIVDPEKIDTSDITAGKEYIRSRGLNGRDIRSSIQSLDVTDITRSHVADMNVLSSLSQIVTGINENALGQYSSGRRSATEAKGVSNSAASRLKMHGMLAWWGGIEPLGQKIVSNTNQLRSEEFYKKIIGEDITKFPFEETIIMDPADIVGGFSFQPYDGTMPNERAQRAQYFTTLLESMAKNPMEMQQLMQVDFKKVLEHVFSLYGVRNFEDFALNPQALNQPLNAQVMPDAQVQQMLASGQLQNGPDLGALLAR